MSSEEARQESADAPYKFDYGPVFVHIDHRPLMERIKDPHLKVQP